ncbi:MAG: hypothetical protein KGJ23_12980 [Euryarchaeota archaeon]|nr:hypothetical protein [Euryarchaeota archaeon]MDE1837513.1 hypothetical protein [Euryarchaeota archaeon]MDE1882027.1 hypothetical protein [Euryarchaeota archaeon]MDE2045521.1 hypothetical protein [Thermoplasmata archaeon]
MFLLGILLVPGGSLGHPVPTANHSVFEKSSTPLVSPAASQPPVGYFNHVPVYSPYGPIPGGYGTSWVSAKNITPDDLTGGNCPTTGTPYAKQEGSTNFGPWSFGNNYPGDVSGTITGCRSNPSGGSLTWYLWETTYTSGSYYICDGETCNNGGNCPGLFCSNVGGLGQASNYAVLHDADTCGSCSGGAENMRYYAPDSANGQSNGYENGNWASADYYYGLINAGCFQNSACSSDLWQWQYNYPHNINWATWCTLSGSSCGNNNYKFHLEDTGSQCGSGSSPCQTLTWLVSDEQVVETHYRNSIDFDVGGCASSGGNGNDCSYTGLASGPSAYPQMYNNSAYTPCLASTGDGSGNTC